MVEGTEVAGTHAVQEGGASGAAFLADSVDWGEGWVDTSAADRRTEAALAASSTLTADLVSAQVESVSAAEHAAGAKAHVTGSTCNTVVLIYRAGSTRCVTGSA